jgi:hypothetical protein
MSQWFDFFESNASGQQQMLNIFSMGFGDLSMMYGGLEALLKLLIAKPAAAEEIAMGGIPLQPTTPSSIPSPSNR